MTGTKGKQLKVGAQVKWIDGCLGTVIDKNWHALMIKWDDGVECIFQFKHNEPQWKALEVVA